VTEYSVQPVAVLGALGGISSFSLIAVDIVRVVAGPEKAECSPSVVHEAVGTGLDESLVSETFIVEVALTLVGDILGPRPAAVGTTGGRAALLGSSEISFEIVRILVPLGGRPCPGWGVQGGERHRLQALPL